MKLVKFLRNHSIYNKGEAAGFEDTLAEALVAKGVAGFWPPAEGEDIGATVIEPQAPEDQGGAVIEPTATAGQAPAVAEPGAPGEPPVQGRKARV